MRFPGASTYAASKAAVVAFTDCLQVELSGTGVTTLCLVTPGIKTRMFDEIDAKYSHLISVPTDHITADQYAQQIKDKIISDAPFLMPKGMTTLGLWISRHTPALFQSAIKYKYKRK